MGGAVDEVCYYLLALAAEVGIGISYLEGGPILYV
jgi:hypothetical protein